MLKLTSSEFDPIRTSAVTRKLNSSRPRSKKALRQYYRPNQRAAFTFS